MQIVDPARLGASPAARRVVITGGGYAGITLAVTLAHRMRPADGIEIVLVDPRPYQQALSELDLVAAGTPRPQFAELWHAYTFRGLAIETVYDRLERVNHLAHRISVGPRDAAVAEIGYWRLVIATGARPHLPPIPGLAEHAVTMWSVSDAQELQRRIGAQFKLAAMLSDAAERRKALSLTVIGGGATGIEVIGTIASELPGMIRRVGYDPCDLRLNLVEGRPDILYDLPERQRAKARRRLEKMGVTLHLGKKLEAVGEDWVRLESGHEVHSAVVVWCGGAHADPDATSWGLEVDRSGRLLCDPELKATGVEDVYVAGDVAAFKDADSGRILPMLAQFAIREAEHVADNILREARGQALARFEPHMHGEFVSVGPRWGVGLMFGVPVSGFFAIVMKRLTYVMYWLQVGSFRLAWSRFRQMMRLRG